MLCRVGRESGLYVPEACGPGTMPIKGPGMMVLSKPLMLQTKQYTSSLRMVTKTIHWRGNTLVFLNRFS